MNPSDQRERFVIGTHGANFTSYTCYQRDAPWLHGIIRLQRGWAHDPSEQAGLAHFVEHVLARNAPGGPSGFQQAFARLGGEGTLGATGVKFIEYTFTIPATESALLLALEQYAALLFKPSDQLSGLEEERLIIIREFHQRYPGGVDELLRRQEHKDLFPKYWLEHSASPLGTLDSIIGIQRDDVAQFLQKSIHPHAIQLFLIGGMPTQHMSAVIDQSPFAHIHSRGTNFLVLPNENIPRPTNTVQTISVAASFHGRTTTSSIRCACAMPSGPANRTATSILATMLSELLERSLRDEGKIAYASHVHVEELFQARLLSISLRQIDPSRVPEALARITTAIVTLGRQRGLFDSIQSQLAASLRLQDLNGREILRQAADSIHHRGQRVQTQADSIAQAELVQFENVLALAEYLKPDRLRVLTLNP